MSYQQIYDLVLEGKSFEDIANKTGISIPELNQIIPLVYDQITNFYQEKAPHAAAINFARIETLIETIMTKIPEANARDLVSLSNSLTKLIEAQTALKNEIKTQKTVIPMVENKKETIPKITSSDEKKRTFLEKHKDKMGVLSPGERGLLENLTTHDPD